MSLIEITGSVNQLRPSAPYSTQALRVTIERVLARSTTSDSMPEALGAPQTLPTVLYIKLYAGCWKTQQGSPREEAEQMADSKLHGVIPIVPTPFNRQADPDLEGLCRIVDYLIDAGVHGMAVLGMASEACALTDGERALVISAAARKISGRVPLVAGCSHNSGAAVAKLAWEAAEAGADALMIMPPAMGEPSTDAILRYFTAAGGATDLPIMIQDNPSWTGVGIPVSLYEALSGMDTVRYAKVETRHPPTTMTAIRAAVDNRLDILGGQAGLWLPEELARGSVGTMPGMIMPQIYVQVWDLWTAGKHAEARAIFDRYFPLIRLTSTPGVGIPMTKQILHQLGLIANPSVREPLSPLQEQDYIDLDAVCRTLDVLTIMQSHHTVAG